MLDVFRNHLCAAFLRVIVNVTIPVAKLSSDIDNVGDRLISLEQGWNSVVITISGGLNCVSLEHSNYIMSEPNT